MDSGAEGESPPRFPFPPFRPKSRFWTLEASKSEILSISWAFQAALRLMVATSLLNYRLPATRLRDYPSYRSIMLSNIRKYTGLMFVVLILLFVGLVFLQSSGGSKGYGSGAIVVEIDGHAYPEEEFQRLAVNPLRCLQEISNPRSSFQAYIAIGYGYLNTMTQAHGALSGEESVYLNFLANRLILQRTAKELGIHASTQEVEEFIREEIFVNNDKTFNADLYNKYVKESLPRLGMSVKDLNELMREVIALKRLQDIFGAGLEGSPSAAREELADTQQEVSYSLITFASSKFEAAEEPTEEEVKTYWEENQGRYMSDAMRRVTYIVATPDFDVLLEAEKEAREKAKKEAEENKGEAPEGGTPPVEENEAPAPEPNGCGQEPETDPAPVDPPAVDPPAVDPPAVDPPAVDPPAVDPPAVDPPKFEPPVTLSNAQRDAAIMKEGGRIDDLWEKLRQDDGKDLEGKAAEAEFEVKTTALFTKASCPDEFRTATQGPNRKRAVDIIFDATKGTKPMDAISDAHRLGPDSWIIFRLDEIVEPKELDYESAKDEARLDLVKEKGRTKMAEAAEAARAAILELMTGGKSFEEAAKEQELEIVVRDAVKSDNKPPGEPTPEELFRLASKVNPGELSKVLTQNDDVKSVFRSLFLHVDKRELVKTAIEESAVNNQLRTLKSNYRELALQNWLGQEFKKSKVVIPKKTP